MSTAADDGADRAPVDLSLFRGKGGNDQKGFIGLANGAKIVAQDGDAAAITVLGNFFIDANGTYSGIGGEQVINSVFEIVEFGRAGGERSFVKRFLS